MVFYEARVAHLSNFFLSRLSIGWSLLYPGSVAGLRFDLCLSSSVWLLLWPSWISLLFLSLSQLFLSSVRLFTLSVHVFLLLVFAWLTPRFTSSVLHRSRTSRFVSLHTLTPALRFFPPTSLLGAFCSFERAHAFFALFLYIFSQFFLFVVCPISPLHGVHFLLYFEFLPVSFARSLLNLSLCNSCPRTGLIFFLSLVLFSFLVLVLPEL